MAPRQIIIIRHAQKPTAKPRRRGVREDGTNDHESLTVEGWQHAGSLAAIFAGPGPNPLEHGLNRPDVIFSAGIGKKRVRGAPWAATADGRCRPSPPWLSAWVRQEKAPATRGLPERLRRLSRLVPRQGR
jgi:hypothetical protein